MCTKCQNNVVLDLQIFRIRKVLNMEELLNLLHTFFGQVDVPFFLIHNEITGLFNVLTKDGIHLGKFTARFTFLKLTGKCITRLV